MTGEIDRARSSLRRVAEQAKSEAQRFVEQERDLYRQARDGLILPAARDQKVSALRAEAQKTVEALRADRDGAVQRADTYRSTVLKRRLTGLPAEARERAARLIQDGGYGRASDAERVGDTDVIAAMLLEASYDRKAPAELLESLEARLARMEGGPLAAYVEAGRDAHVAEQALSMLTGVAKGEGRRAIGRGLMRLGHAQADDAQVEAS
jgi:hypothetical protein